MLSEGYTAAPLLAQAIRDYKSVPLASDNALGFLGGLLTVNGLMCAAESTLEDFEGDDEAYTTAIRGTVAAFRAQFFIKWRKGFATYEGKRMAVFNAAKPEHRRHEAEGTSECINTLLIQNGWMCLTKEDADFAASRREFWEEQCRRAERE